MPPLEPSDAELDRHRRAVAKLRAKLFSFRSLTDFHIIDEPTVVSPSVSELSFADGKRRTVSLGGLKFTIDRGVHQHDFPTSITHDRDDKFTFVVSNDRHTMKCMTVAFSNLDRILERVVESIRKSNIDPKMRGPTTERTKPKLAAPLDNETVLLASSSVVGDMVVRINPVQADQTRRVVWTRVVASTTKKIGGMQAAAIKLRITLRLLPRESPVAAQRRIETEALRLLSLSRLMVRAAKS